MEQDVLVIGAGLSGLTAASLLAKRGLSVTVAEHADRPGGSCGAFKRKGAVFDQGASMLYGFGARGFNAHRFLFSCLEEPFAAVRHALLYTVRYDGKIIRFPPEVGAFVKELSAAFPDEARQIARFYRDMERLYDRVIAGTPSYTTPDETNPREALRSLSRHPLSYLRFLSYLNISAEKLLRSYFKSPALLNFFGKLTSTYCYAPLSEAPAVLASVMFIDNHVGGSWYPAGSTLLLPGTLEKVIEEHGGVMRYGCMVKSILFRGAAPCGAVLESGEVLTARQIVYSGTVWNLYGKLLAAQALTAREKRLASQQPTYPSVVLYALVDAAAIPADACPVEMLAANPRAIDESEITVYIPSLDDRTLCPPGFHTVEAIGPSFRDWSGGDYERQKREELVRLTAVLERRFPGFSAACVHRELATPRTIERYTLKNGGAVAGPKQLLGQHLLLRQSIRTRWPALFCCGESTTLGTGTPTVTVSGIAAANAVLRARGLSPYVWKPDMKNHVAALTPPVGPEWRLLFHTPEQARLMELAQRCRFCERPSCCETRPPDIPGILRRVACGNFFGARQALALAPENGAFWAGCEARCVQAPESPVPLREILRGL